jgi:hypothetical protein
MAKQLMPAASAGQELSSAAVGYESPAFQAKFGASLLSSSRYSTSVNHTFTASWQIRSAFALVFVSAPLLCWLARNQDGAVFICLLCLAGVVFTFLGWPRAIHLDSEGIWQRNRWGKVRRISWIQVDSVAHVTSTGCTIVGGGDVEIVHSMLHQDQLLFEKIVNMRTAVSVFVGGS